MKTKVLQQIYVADRRPAVSSKASNLGPYRTFRKQNDLHCLLGELSFHLVKCPKFVAVQFVAALKLKLKRNKFFQIIVQ